MVLDDHEVAGGEGGVDGAGRVREHERPHAEAAEDPDREDDLVEGVALVEVDAPLHCRHRHAAGAADDEGSGVADDGGGREVGNLAEGHGHGVLEGLGERPEPGAEDDADRGPQRGAASHDAGGLLQPFDEAHSSAPAMQAVMKFARVPASRARSPSRARSLRRSGTSAPMPPIWMPIELKLAKPHRA